MAELATVSPVSNKPKMIPNVVFITGKIAGGRIVNTDQGRLYLHLVKTKAKDEFSHPGTLEISANTRLASTGEPWEGLCEVTGYPRSFDQTDKETGETKTIHTANIQLRAIVD